MVPEALGVLAIALGLGRYDGPIGALALLCSIQAGADMRETGAVDVLENVDCWRAEEHGWSLATSDNSPESDTAFDVAELRAEHH